MFDPPPVPSHYHNGEYNIIVRIVYNGAAVDGCATADRQRQSSWKKTLLLLPTASLM